MLKLNTDEIKNLQFEVSIQGINYDELHGSLKFMIEDVEYGIPVKIQKDLVSVEVPPLQEIVAKGMKHGDIVECKLDIFGNGFYINPWGGQFELQTPRIVETKNVNITGKKPIKSMVAEIKPSSKHIDNETILEMLFERLEEKGFKIPKSEPVVEKSCSAKPKKSAKKTVSETPKLSRKELVEQKIKEKYSKVNNLIKNVKSLTEGKKVIRNPSVVLPKEVIEKTNLDENQAIYDKLQQLNKTQKTEQVITVDKEDPIFLMESVGMKNPRIQQAMIEKAIELGGDGQKAMVVSLKKLLGINESNSYDQYMSIIKRHD